MRDHGARNQQGLRRLWAQTFGAPMWRSLTYGMLSLPGGIGSLLLALVGAHQAAARLQRRLATAGCGAPWRRRKAATSGAASPSTPCSPRCWG
jgi:hypothetical protein